MTDSQWIPPDTFADRLLRARKGRKLTVEKAAALAGVSPATWSTWERGVHPRDLLDVVQRVSDGLEVDRDWLTWGSARPTTVDLRKTTASEGSGATTSGSSGRTRQAEQPIERRRDWVRRERWEREHTRRLIPAQRHALVAA